jgi:hypothetical protein
MALSFRSLDVSFVAPTAGSPVEPTESTIDLTRSEAIVALERADRSNWVGHKIGIVAEVIDDQNLPVIDLTSDQPWTAGYHRTSAELAGLEQKLIATIDPELAALSGLVIVEVDPASPLVDFGRTKELEFGWEDLPMYMKGYEHAAPGSFLVDFDRPDGPRIVFAGRSVRGRLLGTESCGSQVIDTVGHLTAAEVRSYYGVADLHSCYDITTAYRINGLERSRRHAEYFLHMFMVMMRTIVSEDVPYCMAYMNPMSKHAMERAGLPMMPLCGKEIVAPLVGGHEYNAAFQAIAISVDEVSNTLYNPSHPFSELVEPFRSVEIPLMYLRVPSVATVSTR